MSSNRWNTQKETIKQVDLTINHEIPATVVVLEAWSDEITHYVFNDAKYKKHNGDEYLKYEDMSFSEDGKWPDPKKMIDYLHGNNMKLILWLVPVIKYVKDTDNEQLIADEEYAIQSGYCVANKDGSPYRITDNWFCNSLLPDYSNPDAKSWWIKKRNYLIEELGVDGFKTDGSEFVYHDDLCFFNGKNGDEMRNKYPIDYISAFHELIGQERVTFSRAGFTGAQKYPMYWAGDQESTFSELRNVLNAGLSINLSGNPLWGFDIAGFYGAMPGYELYARSTELAAFSPVMQYHSAPTEEAVNNDRTPWNVSEWNNDIRVLELYKKYTNIRMNILPYIYQEAQYITNSSEPLMRHLIIDFPNDDRVYDIDDEYMLGRSLLIAPVITEGDRSRSIYLPDGQWTDFWDGTLYEGKSYINYQSDIERIPVFIRNNSVIPLNLDHNFEIGAFVGNNVSSYNDLCFVVTGQIDGEYRFTDDLGNNITLSEGFHAKISGNMDRIYVFSQSSVKPGTKRMGIKLNNATYNMCILERED
jgi:alpha-glucosidase (family GH31 glycosyl hydrolase)